MLHNAKLIGRPVSISLLALLGIFSLVFLLAVAKTSAYIDGVRYFTLGDDAMISMRYAYNLAHGNGLVWNAGEYVQGMTNLGWTMIMCLVHWLRLPLNVNSLVVQMINLFLALLLIAYVFFHLQARADSGTGLAASILVAFNAPLFVWGVEGFETTLQALLITIAFLRLIPINGCPYAPRRLYLVPILCALAFLTRPDSLIFFALGTVSSIAIAYALNRSGSLSRTDKTNLALSIACGFILIAGVLVAQRLYYGEWLPNTYYLKASADSRSLRRGVEYFLSFALNEFQWPLLLAPVIYCTWGLSNRVTRLAYLPVSASIALWYAYVLWVGGDVFTWGRFFLPLVPILIVCTVLLVRRCLQPELGCTGNNNHIDISFRFVFASWRHWLAICTVLSLLGTLFLFDRTFLSFDRHKAVNASSILVARTLKQLNLPADTTIGVFFAGVTPYLMPEYRFHDFLGKCDYHIARTKAHPGPAGHNKWDFDYSLGTVAPAILITAAPYNNPNEIEIKKQIDSGVDYGFVPSLWMHPLFKKFYQHNRIAVPELPWAQNNNWVYARVSTSGH